MMVYLMLLDTSPTTSLHSTTWKAVSQQEGIIWGRKLDLESYGFGDSRRTIMDFLVEFWTQKYLLVGHLTNMSPKWMLRGPTWIC